MEAIKHHNIFISLFNGLAQVQIATFGAGGSVNEVDPFKH